MGGLRRLVILIKAIDISLAVCSILLFGSISCTSPINNHLESLLSYGKDYLAHGDYKLANECFKKALSEQRIKTLDKIDCLISLGTISWNLDRYKESADYFSEAIVLSNDRALQEQRTFCQDAFEIHGLFMEALDNRAKHNTSLSNAFFDQAFKKAAEIKSQPHELKILRVWSANYTATNDRDRLRDLNLQALEFSLVRNRSHLY
jgi:tetratricopeptide (TPR) repeat protein